MKSSSLQFQIEKRTRSVFQLDEVYKAYFWLRPIALGPTELPRHQAGASAAATRRAYLIRSRLKVDDSEGFTVGWRATRRDDRADIGADASKRTRRRVWGGAQSPLKEDDFV